MPLFIVLTNSFLAKWLKLSASNQKVAGLSHRAITIVPNLDTQCFFRGIVSGVSNSAPTELSFNPT